MKLIFILGEIISNIEFKFIINKKNKSISVFKIKLLNDSILEIKAYNENADYCISKLNKGDIIYIEGFLNSKMQILAKYIEKQEIKRKNMEKSKFTSQSKLTK